MKITFEGNGIHDILEQMEAMIGVFTHRKNILKSMSENSDKKAIPPAAPQGPGPEPLAPPPAPVDKPVDKPAKPVNPQIAKMQAAKAAKKAEREAAAAQPAPAAPAPAQKAAAPLDPADLVKLRTKTIEELQAAYANGHQKEVFELLSRFGNGAKSFRELPPEAFAPIREAIDLGALT
jgi:outer membrane biosynthesis protein TonB